MAKIFLVCTGLGVVQRGFESYIYSLATKLKENKFEFILYSGGKLDPKELFWKKITSIDRKNRVTNLLFGASMASEIELLTFFFSLCIQIFIKKPSVVYLGEYKLYCYLFKFRTAFKLKYSLALYTGGQVIPGIFDINKDFVHHITDVYIDTLIQNGFPRSRQFLLPHFLSTNGLADENFIKQLKSKAYPKKIILSVGIVDRDIKRMDLLIQTLAKDKEIFFPILLGETSVQTKSIIEYASNLFGINQFIISKVNRGELVNYYKAADAFVLLSPKESFGLAYLEALEVGLPVIACDFYESKSVLKDSVTYITEGQIAELSSILKEIIESNNDDEASKRKAFVSNNYTWSILKPAYIDMFNKISNNHLNV